MEWIAKNVLNVGELVGRSSTESEETARLLRKQMQEDVEIENICDIEELQWHSSREDWREPQIKLQQLQIKLQQLQIELQQMYKLPHFKLLHNP